MLYIYISKLKKLQPQITLLQQVTEKMSPITLHTHTPLENICQILVPQIFSRVLVGRGDN